MIPLNPSTQQPDNDRILALAESLRAGSQGKANLAGLDEQYARAEALGKNTAKADRWGQVGILENIGDVVSSSRSRAQMRDLRPQRKAARMAMADNENASVLYQAKTAQNKEQTRVNELLTKRKTDADNFKISNSKVLELENIADPKQVIQARSFGGKIYDGDGNQLNNREWQQRARPSSRVSSSQHGRFLRSKSEDPFGNDVITIFDKQTGEEKVASFGNGDPYTREEAEKRGGERAAQKGKETLAKEKSKYSVTRQGELMETSQSNSLTLNSIDQAINALRAGAGSGPIESRLPSFKASTLALENAQENLGLTQIGSYTFGSLSEAEGMWLRRSVIPPLDEDELLPYMIHRKEATMRVMEATAYEREALAAGEEVDMELIRGILTDGGFDITGGYE